MGDDRFMRLKADFDAAHRMGMEALLAGDYAAFGEAIRREREIIKAQGAVIAERIEASKAGGGKDRADWLAVSRRVDRNRRAG